MILRARRAVAYLAVLALAGSTGFLASADDSVDQDVARIEEDWQLVVNSPDNDNNGPQVTCVISPGSLDDGYCAFDLNYATQPDYAAGGVQMHVWSPNAPIVTKNLGVEGQLQQANETVTWTQSMSVSGGYLTFQLSNGQSDTWGAFGGDDATACVQPRNATLSNYSPEQSVKNSGVSFATNLVDSLTLKAVRYYDGAGKLIRADTNSRSVVQQN